MAQKFNGVEAAVLRAGPVARAARARVNPYLTDAGSRAAHRAGTGRKCVSATTSAWSPQRQDVMTTTEASHAVNLLVERGGRRHVVRTGNRRGAPMSGSLSDTVKLVPDAFTLSRRRAVQAREYRHRRIHVSAVGSDGSRRRRDQAARAGARRRSRSTFDVQDDAGGSANVSEDAHRARARGCAGLRCARKSSGGIRRRARRTRRTPFSRTSSSIVRIFSGSSRRSRRSATVCRPGSRWS